jgi:hypothetical protein
MAAFNAAFPMASPTPALIGFTTRSIQNSGATSGFQYIFICPADFANGATFRFNISVSANGNGSGRSENVSARLYSLNGSGIANTAAPVSAITNRVCTPANFPPGEVVEISLTLTSALTIGTRYALRIFPDTTLNNSITFNVTYSTGPYTGAVDEYHVNGVTLSTGYPNLAIGTASSWYTPKCTRAATLLTTATSTTTSQVGFRFSLPSGVNYTLKNIRLIGLVLSATGATTGSFIGRILDSTGATTLVSSRSVLHTDIRAATSAVVSLFKFEFVSEITLTGGTTYFFVVESDLDKRLSYIHFQEDTDSSQTFSGEVNSIDVVSRNGTSGVFTSFTTLGPPAYRAVPFAEIDAIPVASVGGSGMLVHPGMSGGIRG